MKYITPNSKLYLKTNTQKPHIKNKTTQTISTILIFTLLFSLTTTIITTFNDATTLASGAPDTTTVKNEKDLRSAIAKSTGAAKVIVFAADITLTKEPLDISLGKNITLKSDKTTGFWKLTGAPNQDTITIDNGTLTLDGIIVTHEKGANGRGINVMDNMNNNSSKLFIIDGAILGNTLNGADGGGVYIGRLNQIIMSGGIIANNTATNGGGVYLSNMSSANIISMTNGIISNNTATDGGGVYVGQGRTFNLQGGIIANNTATNGGGIYLANSSANLSGSSALSGNRAINDGGGIWITGTNNVTDFKRLSVGTGVVFSNNRASTAYNRDSFYNSIYNTNIKGTKWSSPFTQGYNNFDVSYTNGTRIPFYNVTVQDSNAASTWTGNYLAGELVTVNAGTRKGYVFSGWTITEGNVSLSNSTTTTFTMPQQNIALTTIWTPTIGPTSPDPSDPTDEDNTGVSLEQIAVGIVVPSIAVPAVVKGSMSLRKKRRFNKNTDANKESGSKDESQFKTLSYTVEHYQDDVFVESTVVEKKVLAKMPDRLFVVPLEEAKYEGYMLDHTDPAELQLTIANDSTIKAYYVTGKKPMEGEKVTIFFDANDDDRSVETPPDTQVTYGEPYGTLPTLTGKRPHHIFLGWYTSPPNNTRITETTTVKNPTSHTLYAHWLENANNDNNTNNNDKSSTDF